MLRTGDIERAVRETAAACGIGRASLFGGYRRNEQGEQSDVDLVLELERPLGFERAELRELLRRWLGVPVDIVFGEGQLCDPVRRQFQRDRVVLYGG